MSDGHGRCGGSGHCSNLKPSKEKFNDAGISLQNIKRDKAVVKIEQYR